MADLRSANANAATTRNPATTLRKVEIHQEEGEHASDHPSSSGRSTEDEFDYEPAFVKHDDIPPVPPLPKEFVDAAATSPTKKNTCLARLVEDDSRNNSRPVVASSSPDKAKSAAAAAASDDLDKENFQWPEDVF